MEKPDNTQGNTLSSQDMRPDTFESFNISSKSETQTTPQPVSKVYLVDGSPVSEDFLKRVVGETPTEDQLLNEQATVPYKGFDPLVRIDFRYGKRCIEFKLETLDTILFLILAGRANPDTGLVSISQVALQGLTGCTHKTTVSRSIKRLLQHGLIKLDKPHFQHHTNTYKIMNFVV